MTDTNTDMTGKGQTDAGGTAKEMAEDLKGKARDVAGNLTSEAAGYADQARDTAAEEVRGIADALRTAAGELRDGSPQARTFGQIAETLASASDSIRDKDLSEILDVANDFARRNPLVFLGSAALVGFAVTRFAKASRDGSSQNFSSQNFASSGQQRFGGSGDSVDLRHQSDFNSGAPAASSVYGQGGVS